MKINELTIEEFDSVFGLLAEAKLDHSDLKQPNIRLFQFEENNLLIGAGSLEIFNNQALLRSVAVKNEFQAKGFGKEMVAQIEQIARQSGIKSLYLLTTTASGFFKSIGYQKISREYFAEPLKQTAQFTGLCPASAICMKKEI